MPRADEAPARAAELQGVILCAGKGTRIQPFSDRFPKPMLPILDRPLLVWQIEAMRELGVREIVVVIGHLGHRVVESLGDGRELGVELSYVEQESMLGIAHAVGQLDAHVSRPFLLFLGDIFFETRNLGSIVDAFHRDGVEGVLAVKREPDVAALRRNFTVELDEAGFVRQVVEKPRTPRTDRKGCGLYLFDTTFFDAVRRTPRTALRDEYELTEAIQIFIDEGHRVASAEVVERDLNLSMPPDLLEINLYAMERAGFERWIAEDAVVEDGAVVERSVVMPRATVRAGARLDRCLVMPGELVGEGDYERVIFGSGQELACH